MNIIRLNNILLIVLPLIYWLTVIDMTADFGLSTILLISAAIAPFLGYAMLYKESSDSKILSLATVSLLLSVMLMSIYGHDSFAILFVEAVQISIFMGLVILRLGYRLFDGRAV